MSPVANKKSIPDSGPPDLDKNKRACIVLQKAADFRPELRTLDAMCGASDRSVFADFMHLMRHSQPLYYRLIVCNVDKYEGNELYKNGHFALARAKYLEAARKILGEEFEFPVPPTCVKVGKYMQLEWREMMDVVTCFSNMAQCFIKEGDIGEALEWLHEVAMLYMNQVFGRNEPLFGWKNTNLLVEEYYLNQQKYHLRLSQSFMALKNTSSVVHHSWAVTGICGSILESKSERMVKLEEEANASKCAEYRHPHIGLGGRLQVDYPELQIRGKWGQCRYMILKDSRPPSPRVPMGCWIWRGKLYVAGGQGAIHENLRDLWCLPLSDGPLEKTWRRLQDIPPSSKGGPRNNCTSGLLMKLWNNTAYLFHGSKTILTFDLMQEKWASRTTRFNTPGKSWPYFHNILVDYGIEIHNGKMYIFGGQDGRRQLGCNVFMCLDLETLSWEWLSGTSQPIPTFSSPMLRVHPITWILPSEDRLFVMYGNANRIGERISNPTGPHGANSDYTYDDLWSYHIPHKTWTREKMRGNYPSPRTESFAIYNERMDRVVAFGGYCGTTNTYIPERDISLNFAYYADTYIWHPETRKWAQVLTRGFPTYRAGGQLLFDTGSGKNYLFGGHTNSEFAPSKYSHSRAFNDLWELKIGVEDRELVDEERTAVMGPWGTCFRCGKVGLWRMCGGSCRGVVRYCSGECGGKAWGEHKLKHGCVNKPSEQAMRARR